ncbi:helix-turn-helix domain-containing protein [Azospirillum brasilense]|uniref:LysR family transcriptional regulator n=1 Tax=Azospirillum brasilense TaxID=192 RepID=A0A6L3AYU3_AZOBR|nr:LysR family transcriptional regulator [Azospirillum brasilense]KAA0684437.1 LysR family transcriptional regulator [Azospirillum brasilense]
MRSRQLESFILVCELGSISKAALALNIAQPALGVPIKALEREFGVPLLVRTVTGTHPGRPPLPGRGEADGAAFGGFETVAARGGREGSEDTGRGADPQPVGVAGRPADGTAARRPAGGGTEAVRGVEPTH